MKKTIFGCLLMVCMLTTVNAQFRNIPSVVTDSFSLRYANATHVEWKDKITSFQASFEQNNETFRTNFSSKGEWLRTEKDMDMTLLPEPVKDGFEKSKYAGYDVKEITEVDDREKGHNYKVVVNNGTFIRRNLVFTTKGQLVKDEMNF